MKTILVPTDFSDCANRATEAAVSLAVRTDSEIHLHHAVNTQLLWNEMSLDEQKSHPETYGKTLKSDAQLDKMLNKGIFTGVPVRKVLQHGSVYQTIMGYADQCKADMIVMGSHGNEGSDKFFIGSNIQKVLREARCPVLTIKKASKVTQWRKIVYASSFSEEAHQPFEKIMAFARQFDAIIYLLYVNVPAKFKDTRTAMKQINDFASHYQGVRFEKVIYDHYELEDGILDFAQDVQPDVLALAPHNRRALAQYLIGVTETLVYRSDIPVLSVNA